MQWLVLGGVAALGVAMTSSGVFASWVATAQSTTGTTKAATVSLVHNDTNGTVFSSGVNDLLPGDYLYRYANLVNSGDLAQDFTATLSGGGALAAAGGLQFAVDSCSVSWANDGSCSGTLLPVATARDVAGSAGVALGQVAAAGSAHLRYKFLLNPSADQATFQGKTGTISVTIGGSTPVTGGRNRTAG
ncbi:TasA family protein [Actinoplanes sp. NPDC051859]|uniref:TasA family protein n=1 Tax=Actinoplanes sp. NPDC051859 TaxID=3363909 RepID=UPI00379858E7